MFSTITNMLPSLSLQGDKDQATPTPSTSNPFDKLMAVKRRFEGARTSTSVADHEPEPEPEPEPEEEIHERKEKRKPKPLNETFVVVRPPPKVSNHPLNLQLQLIPPVIQSHVPRSASTSTTASASSAGERTYTGAGLPNVPPVSAGLQSRKETKQTAEPQQDDELLNRRANRSDISLFYSSMGSSASVTSLSTVASTTSGARRIIPLYNLSAHNVLQNTVQDAGTDATVSRFRKRGIEIIGLGTLEPVEVHGQMPTGAVAGCQPDFEPSDAGHGSNLGHGISESDHSPPSASGHEPVPVIHLRERPSQSYLRGRTSPSPPSQLREVYVPEEPVKAPPSKTFFGKLFKKKELPSVPPSPGLLSPTVAPRASTVARPGQTQPQPRPVSTASARPTSVYSVVPPSPATTISPPTPTSATTAASYYQPPVLGTQATLRTDTFPPPSRPAAYVWVLRRWTKGAGVLSGLGVGGVDMVRVGVEVRFEWVRGKKKRSSPGPSPVGRPVSVVSVDEGNLGIPESGSVRSTSPDGRSESGRPRSDSGRPRSDSGHPRSDSGRTRSDSKRSAHPSSSDDGDESDPEDSETPWSCTLRIIPLDQSSSPLKLRLAHLVPAPHHPKVVSQFKMPFPLPDVNIQTLELVPRSVLDPFGMDGGKEMVLSAEEIKDVVCTTALWLMVREGFGGLAGKKRKGDGWKIRS
ncbi:unnamed protein product [Rhizoctonia solani]|uniref:Uncharacterized protein n=3 Tax=Rhizoctonia solani TaxID=456999 RepID=A0A8H3A968_9AGAM|nr:hypothetical protein RSOL_283840 [Rhizoctonia solani AG-3 Rhs1AP]KEP46187.1 hypothetical protein V565_213450 [Rhizoctonia solani 123E]CAE6416480.1 unnamed protein product [Rhizoctonia solani]CAE6520889.1 unnamed protein product [Rhizoctonia solani]